MPVSTVSIPNRLYNAMFKWFWTMFSLGAPDLKAPFSNWRTSKENMDLIY